MKKIQVFLAEDHHLVRTALRVLLTAEADIEVVGEAGNVKELLPAVAQLKPDVLLLDAHMPGGGVIPAAQTLREKHPDVRILVVSAHERTEYVVGLVRAGVAGYVLKLDSPDMLVEAVRAVAQGEKWLSPRVADVLMRAMQTYDDRPAARLTEREIEVLNLMAQGYRNDDIALNLVITVSTVKNHIRRIFRKLGVETRVEAILYAIEHELDRS